MIPQRIGGSFRDPDGFCYLRDGELRRQIHASGRADWSLLQQSGLLEVLWRDQLLVRHRDAPIEECFDDRAIAVIAPEPIPFISYPYEWSPSQLQQAAALTLRIQSLALGQGMTLKDASAYNIQWNGNRPQLIDTLSFTRYQEGTPWVAYRQFCQHFLGPLALMHHTDPRLRDLSRVYIDGPPLDLVSRLLPRRTWLRPSLLAHLHLHARSVAKHAGDSAPRGQEARVSRRGLDAVIEHLATSVASLGYRELRTEWHDYEHSHNYSDAGQEAKEAYVRATGDRCQPRIVLDLGANTGKFSEVLVASGAYVVAIDSDVGAVELLGKRLATRDTTRLLPLWIDLSNPSPAQGWAHGERESLTDRGPVDLVLALALVHHLAIGNNVPLDAILAHLLQLGRRVVVEWVPKSDPQAQRLLVSREDVFREYTLANFIAASEQIGIIEAQATVPGSERVLFTITAR